MGNYARAVKKGKEIANKNNCEGMIGAKTREVAFSLIVDFMPIQTVFGDPFRGFV